MKRQLSSRDYAALADDSYMDRVADPNRPIEIEGRMYSVLATANHVNGYQGTVYLDIESNTIVVAHRGSERDTALKFAQDWGFTNRQMVLSRTNPQLNSADALTQKALKLAEFYPSANGQPAQVTTTGHSMGGTHAQVMAARHGLHAETFNAYGAHSLGLDIPAGPNGTVINHVRATDIVSAASRHHGEVRVYALRQDVQDLLADGQDPRIQGVNGLARDIAKVGFAPHDIQQFYRRTPGSGAPLISAENAQRHEQNREMFGVFRHDIYQMRAMLGNGMDLQREFNHFIRKRGLPIDPTRWPKLPQELDAGVPDVFVREAKLRLGKGQLMLDTAIDGIRSVPQRVGEKLYQLENNVRYRLGVPLLMSTDGPSSAPALHEPAHPQHAMFKQALEGMQAIDARHQRASDQRTCQAAAALTAAAVGQGMREIDAVVLSKDGSRLIAIENERGNATRRLAAVPTLTALDQSIEHSMTELAQAQQVQASQPADRQQQQLQQQRGVALG